MTETVCPQADELSIATKITPRDWPPAGIESWRQRAPADVALHDQPSWPQCPLPWPFPLPWPWGQEKSELPAGSATETMSARVFPEPVSLTWNTTTEKWCPP